MGDVASRHGRWGLGIQMGRLFGGFFAGALGSRKEIQGRGAPLGIGKLSGCFQAKDGGDRPLDVVESGPEEGFFVQEVELDENFQIVIGPNRAFSGETESGAADGQIVEVDATVSEFAVDVKGIEIDEDVYARDIFDDDVCESGEEGKPEDVTIADVDFVGTGRLCQFAGSEIVERPFGIEIEEEPTFISVVGFLEEIEEFRIADGASAQVEFQACLSVVVLTKGECEFCGTGRASIENVRIDGRCREEISLESDGPAQAFEPQGAGLLKRKRRAQERDGQIGILPTVEMDTIRSEDGAPGIESGRFNKGRVVEGKGERLIGIEESDEMKYVRRVDGRFRLKSNPAVIGFDGQCCIGASLRTFDMERSDGDRIPCVGAPDEDMSVQCDERDARVGGVFAVQPDRERPEVFERIVLILNTDVGGGMGEIEPIDFLADSGKVERLEEGADFLRIERTLCICLPRHCGEVERCAATNLLSGFPWRIEAESDIGEFERSVFAEQRSLCVVETQTEDIGALAGEGESGKIAQSRLRFGILWDGRRENFLFRIGYNEGADGDVSNPIGGRLSE